jgi:anti-sigma regulatory factor (Ser/Thr protein kinase)
MNLMVILGAITLDRHAAEVSTGRRYVSDLLESEGVDNDGIVLAVSELLTNAVDHGGGPVMNLLLAAADDRIHIEVTDAGGTPESPILQPADDPDEEHGRGLNIVAALSASWGVTEDPGSTTVWADMPSKPTEF